MNILHFPRERRHRSLVTAAPPGPGRAARIFLATLICLGALHGAGRATTLLEITLSGPNANLSWNSVPGNTNLVLSRDSLTAGGWVTNATVVADGNTATWTDPAPLVATRFYRVLMPNGEQSLFESPPETPPGAPISGTLGFFDPGSEPFDRGDWQLHAFSGEFVLQSVDLCIPGRGLDFIWARKYRSRVGPDTAQGNGWDFSYNIFARRVGQHVEVHDGNSRRDIFLLQPDGTFACDGFFREGSISNNAFTLMFADKGTWEFHPFDHATSPGRIRRSTDRNGNAMEYQYDGLSRLVRVVDTLGRTNTVSYDGNGFISAVTDFSGRQVRYEYYSNFDPDGSLGDLKLVVSPVVTNTPNGNDFPGGKTNRYTYSKGLTPAALNHNLLTLTDGKGQTWLSNRYHTATSPTNVNYDRLEIPIEIVSLSLVSVNPVYVPITPDPTNNSASKKTIVNDRAGSVREYYYDALNRLVMKRDFTGRATPGTPTTESSNRPTAPLRPSDPPYFEKRIEWNADSLTTRVVHPNTNETQFVYESAINPSASPRLRGNLRALHRLPGPLGGDQPVRSEQFEYAAGFGTSRAGVLAMDADTDNDGNPDQLSFYLRDHNNDTTFTYAAGGDHSALQQGSDPPADPNIPLFGFRIVYADTIEISINGQEAMRSQNTFCTQHTDARGNKSTFSYDARGNCTNVIGRLTNIEEDFEYNAYGQLTAHVLPQNSTGHRRRDEFTYYTSGPQFGYRQNLIVDATISALTTTYEYDSLGRRVRHIDALGHDTLYSVNGLGQVVRTSSREVTTGSGIRYRNDLFYDANNNCVRVDVQNRDETGALGANPDFTTTYEYDSLNRCTRSTHEVDSGQTITNEFIYDPNDHLTVTRSPLAVSGADTTNIVQFTYDERNLPFRKIRGPGGAGQSSTQYDYDANGNRRRTQEGIESTPRVTEYVYDGYDRLVRQTNALGSLTTWHYDPNGNLTSSRFDGETIDVAGGASNIRLRESFHTYDPMNRLTNRVDSFFDIVFQIPIGDGTNTTMFDYSPNGQVKRVTDDNGNSTVYAYDSVNRLVRRTDAKTNSVTYAYDANGNVVQTVAAEKSDLGNPDVGFTNNYAYDNLNRCTQSVDNASIPNQFGYDSRGNRVLHTDGRGIASRYEYDGLSRLVRTVRDMNANGPIATELADIVVIYGYDDASRRVSATDDNTNTTHYAYDSLDRLIRTERMDNTTNRYTYDVRDNVIQITDAQGTVVTNGYDLLDRRNVRRVTTAGAGVGGPTLENFAYDGLSRLVTAGSTVAFTMRRYDSLGNLITEVQQVTGAPPRTNTAAFDGVGNRTQLVYPGGRTLVYAYDPLNRVKTVHDNPPGPATLVVSNSYVGPRRLERVDYANGTRLDVAYDLARRIASTTHTNVLAGTVIDARTYQWDNADNKIFAQEPAGPHNYGYDAANRMIGSIAPLALPEIYQLDGVGNRLLVNGPVDPGPYTMNPTLPEPADFQVNQYTTTPFDGRTYNRNGNLTNSTAGPRNFAYDSHDQLVTFVGAPFNATYKYDCLGRRLEKSVNGQITRFYYDSGRVIEEQNVGNVTAATYCYLPDDIRPGDTISAGPAVDNDDSKVVFCNDTPKGGGGSGTTGDAVECVNYIIAAPVQMQRGANKYYYHSDDLGSVMKVTDQTGAVVEQDQYADYGVPNAPSAIGNPYLFHGMRFEAESGLYCFLGSKPMEVLAESPRRCFIDPRAGRNITGGSSATGNNPASRPAVSRLMEQEGIFYDFSGDPVMPGGGTTSPLNFQSDGPIICQALFQRLVPRPPVAPPPLPDPVPPVSPLVSHRRPPRVVRPVVIKHPEEVDVIDIVISEGDATEENLRELVRRFPHARIIVVVGTLGGGKRG